MQSLAKLTDITARKVEAPGKLSLVVLTPSLLEAPHVSIENQDAVATTELEFQEFYRFS